MKALNEIVLKTRKELREEKGPESAPWGRIDQSWSARPHKYPAGQVHKGHSHIIDHVTFLESGSISVKRNDRSEPKEYVAPMWIFMPAEVWHEITAVTDAKWWCIFYDNRTPEETAPFDAERG